MDSLEVCLPEETVVQFRSDHGRVEIDLKQPGVHRRYLIEEGVGYELDADDLDDTYLVLSELIDGSDAGEILFATILHDLVTGCPMGFTTSTESISSSSSARRRFLGASTGFHP